jgi:nitrite reductase (NADH) small subunit
VIAAEKRRRAIALPASELPEGASAGVEAFGTTVAVFNVGGELFALGNRCPHHGGPLCLGRVSGALLPAEPYEYRWGREDRVLTCPWHGWQFDLESGQALFDPLVRVPRYDVRVEEGQIVLYEC